MSYVERACINLWSPTPSSETWSVSDRWRLPLTQDRRCGLLHEKIGPPPSVNVLWREHSYVNSAENLTKQERRSVMRNSVLHDAKWQTQEEREGVFARESARCVALRSRLTNTHQPKLAVASVVQICGRGTSPVYNLTVEDCPDYFANGVLVHNCLRNLVATNPGGAMKFCRPVALTAWGEMSLLGNG
jgi:hypothetical protein